MHYGLSAMVYELWTKGCSLWIIDHSLCIIVIKKDLKYSSISIKILLDLRCIV